jgi:catechol 2,3-dioxygenase-like lactoylglutathione lyase family enzyme
VPLPGLCRLDHVGFTVPDLDEATRFLVDVLGCEHLYSLGPFADDGDWMAEHLNVHPRATVPQNRFFRVGGQTILEVFAYTAPDQRAAVPRNSDIGGHHIALYVDDIAKAAEYLRSKNVKTMQGPIPVNEGPAAGQSILYFLTPWGLQMELISYPKGMAYESSAKTVLWSTTEPMK